MIPRIVPKLVGANASQLKFAFTGMLIDQLMFAPIFLSGFFMFQSFIQTFDSEGIKKGFQTWKDKIKVTMLTNWKIWPAATMINFMYVPIQYRVLFANFIGLFWNIILSYITYK